MKTYMFKALLFGIGLFGLAITGAYHYPAHQTPEIVNKTTSIQVISVTPGEDGYELRLKNTSTKNINGYSIGSERAYRTSDLTVGDEVISAGDEFTLQLPPIRDPRGPQAASQTTKAQLPAIRYVTFDDGSSDGDDIAAQELKDIRSGRLEQLQRIGLLLEAMAASPDVIQLESQLQALPTKRLRTDRSFNVAEGRLAAKQDALAEVSKLDKSNLPTELLKLTQQHARHLMRLTTR
ncbi:MAG: hypothetical protein ABR568_15540 [Pyrinomonadaceae bacterium]